MMIVSVANNDIWLDRKWWQAVRIWTSFSLYVIVIRHSWLQVVSLLETGHYFSPLLLSKSDMTDCSKISRRVSLLLRCQWLIPTLYLLMPSLYRVICTYPWQFAHETRDVLVILFYSIEFDLVRTSMSEQAHQPYDQFKERYIRISNVETRTHLVLFDRSISPNKLLVTIVFSLVHQYAYQTCIWRDIFRDNRMSILITIANSRFRCVKSLIDWLQLNERGRLFLTVSQFFDWYQYYVYE
jgi:hypothetical protein